ncbi:MAG: hypothetical protein AB7O96_17835 [Pseudobdellovibrionaceae bacterium]
MKKLAFGIGLTILIFFFSTLALAKKVNKTERAPASVQTPKHQIEKSNLLAIDIFHQVLTKKTTRIK